MSRSKLYNN